VPKSLTEDVFRSSVKTFLCTMLVTSLHFSSLDVRLCLILLLCGGYQSCQRLLPQLSLFVSVLRYCRRLLRLVFEKSCTSGCQSAASRYGVGLQGDVTIPVVSCG
jgi:hypothetical protein